MASTSFASVNERQEVRAGTFAPALLPMVPMVVGSS
jgi:hypothetical protein